MENSKYYTPTIEEFHVGFGYERLYYDGSWSKETLEEWDLYTPNLGHGESGNSSLDDILEDLKNNNIRVKYLDKEDIESLGWKQSRNSNTSEIEFELDLGNSLDNLGLLYNTENQYLRIHWFGEGDITRFSGTIKNKSEFKKLMKQLGIYE